MDHTGQSVTETKAERAERLKRELNRWQAAETIARFARQGGLPRRPSGS